VVICCACREEEEERDESNVAMGKRDSSLCVDAPIGDGECEGEENEEEDERDE
jgi:hypothetical protein